MSIFIQHISILAGYGMVLLLSYYLYRYDISILTSLKQSLPKLSTHKTQPYQFLHSIGSWLGKALKYYLNAARPQNWPSKADIDIVPRNPKQP